MSQTRQIEIVVLQAGAESQRVVLRPGTLTLGRADDCDIQLPDAGVSRRHARLQVDGQVVHIEDLGSGNGTWVRGRRIARHALVDGDEVTIDPFVLRMNMASHMAEVVPVARLDVVSDTRMARRSYPLRADGAVTLGRAENNDLVIPEAASSRLHAEVVGTRGTWIVRDQGSANGTFVNGIKVREKPLHAGDVIRIGTVDFAFVMAMVEPDDEANERTEAFDSLVDMPEMFKPPAAPPGGRAAAPPAGRASPPPPPKIPGGRTVLLAPEDLPKVPAPDPGRATVEPAQPAPYRPPGYGPANVKQDPKPIAFAKAPPTEIRPHDRAVAPEPQRMKLAPPRAVEPKLPDPPSQPALVDEPKQSPRPPLPEARQVFPEPRPVFPEARPVFPEPRPVFAEPRPAAAPPDPGAGSPSGRAPPKGRGTLAPEPVVAAPRAAPPPVGPRFSDLPTRPVAPDDVMAEPEAPMPTLPRIPSFHVRGDGPSDAYVPPDTTAARSAFSNPALWIGVGILFLGIGAMGLIGVWWVGATGGNDPVEVVAAPRDPKAAAMVAKGREALRSGDGFAAASLFFGARQLSATDREAERLGYSACSFIALSQMASALPAPAEPREGLTAPPPIEGAAVPTGAVTDPATTPAVAVALAPPTSRDTPTTPTTTRSTPTATRDDPPARIETRTTTPPQTTTARTAPPTTPAPTPTAATPTDEGAERALKYLLEAGKTEYSKGNYAKAVKKWEALMASDPTRASAMYYDAEERIAEAKDAMKASSQKSYAAGLALMKSGQWGPARDQLEKAVAADPFNTAAAAKLAEVRQNLSAEANDLFNQGSARESRGDTESAIDYYQQVVNLVGTSDATGSKASKRIAALKE